MGWASVPYDPFWAHRHPRRAAWMSLAGPGANFTLTILAAVAIHAGIWMGVFTPPETATFMRIVEAVKPGTAEGAAAVLSILFSLNILLALFNLIPVPPLDGKTAIGLILPEKLNDRFRDLTRQPMFQMFGVLLAWYLIDPLFRPVWHGLLLLLIYPGELGH